MCCGVPRLPLHWCSVLSVSGSHSNLFKVSLHFCPTAEGQVHVNHNNIVLAFSESIVTFFIQKHSRDSSLQGFLIKYQKAFSHFSTDKIHHQNLQAHNRNGEDAAAEFKPQLKAINTQTESWFVFSSPSRGRRRYLNMSNPSVFSSKLIFLYDSQRTCPTRVQHRFSPCSIDGAHAS